MVTRKRIRRNPLRQREVYGDGHDRLEADRYVLPLLDGVGRGPRKRVARRSQNSDVADRAVGMNDRVEYDLSVDAGRLHHWWIHGLHFSDERDAAARSETHRSA